MEPFIQPTLDEHIKKLRSLRRKLAKMVCTPEYYVFSTKAPKRAPTYYFQAPLEEGIVIGRIRQRNKYGTKISLYIDGKRRFVHPHDLAKVDSIWDDRERREKVLGRILKNEDVALFNLEPTNGDQVVAVARTARFRSMGRIENLGDQSPLGEDQLKGVIDQHLDDEIALYL